MPRHLQHLYRAETVWRLVAIPGSTLKELKRQAKMDAKAAALREKAASLRLKSSKLEAEAAQAKAKAEELETKANQLSKRPIQVPSPRPTESQVDEES